MSRRLAALFGLAVLAAPVARADEPRRWPLWPSEVTLVAEPLASESDRLHAGDTRRAVAIHALDAYATPLVAPILIAAIDDPVSAIRREVLHACFVRQLLECVPAARKRWRSEVEDPAVRIAALRVVVLAPDPARLQLFLAALRETDPLIRAEAMRTFATVSWPEDQLQIVRANLIAKLPDPAPEVRRAAAHGLGLLGPDTTPGGSKGALALTRLLVDPDPQVRQDTAEALARLHDLRSGPAILRALETGDETFVGRSLLHALAALPAPDRPDGPDGLDVDAELLRLLDAPPRNLLTRHIAEAIARRRAPGPALAEGLIARLREDALRRTEPQVMRLPVLAALLGLGEAARPALRAALTRGLEPPLEREVRRLLAALDPPETAAMLDRPWPKGQDRAGWQAALVGPTLASRLRAAAALGVLGPAWLGGAAGHHLGLAGAPDLRRPWLLALAATTSWTAADPALLVRLGVWSDDPGLASGDRCLALAGLARHRPDRALFTRHAVRNAAAADPAVRACAAGVLAFAPPRAADPLLAGLLRDPSARVRASAALTLACRAEPGPAFAPQLARMAVRDPEPAVVRAVDLARTASAACERWGHVLAAPGETGPWLDLTWRDRALQVPSETLGALRLAWGPGLHEAAAVAPDPAVVTAATSIRAVFD